MSASGDIHAAVPPSGGEHRNVFVLSVSEANALLGQLEGAADSAAATAAAQAHSRSVLAEQRGGLP